ncbi:MAG: TonB-dependent receptor, partial [Pseudomonadota bacterium]
MRAEFSIAATAMALVMTTPAFAQTISGLDEITVTAQRREQAAQDVPVALTVVTGADLQVRGVTQVNGLEYIAPSFQVESQFGSGQPVYTIRGVGFRDYATNNSPTVGIYVDEVAYTAPVMTQGLLFDIERVEVLRGPQGTLYGRNTTGGAVNVISKRPTEEFEAGLLAEYGRFNRFQGEGYVSGALTDWARLRVSASGTQGGAWQVNRETGQELGDAERFAVRTLLEVDAGDRTELLFNVHYYQDKSDGLGLQLFDASVDSTGGFNPGLAGFQPHEGQRSTSFGASALFEDLTGIPAGTKPFRDNEGIGGSLTANIEFDALDLTYIGAYERFDRAEFLDYDAIPLGGSGVFFESDLDVITQEVRLASNGDGPFSWLLGVYYANEELDENYQSDFAETFGLAVFTPYSQEVDTLSVFGQAEWQATDRLNLQLGLRYEDETRDLIGLGTFSPQIAGGVFNFANGSVDGTLEDRSVDLNEVSGKIGAEFD